MYASGENLKLKKTGEASTEECGGLLEENVTEKVKDKAPKAAEKVLEVLPDDFSGMTKYFGV